MIINDRPYHNAAAFSEVFARSSAELLDGSSWRLEVRYIPATRLRWLVYRAADTVITHLRDAYKRSSIMLPIWGAVAITLGVATCLVNLWVRSTVTPPLGLWSSVFLMLRRTHRDSREAQYSTAFGWQTPRISNQSTRSFPSVSEEGDGDRTISATIAADEAPKTSNIQKAHEAVARLLAGRHDVAVYGFDEADASALEAYNVRRLAIYDSNPATVGGRRQLAGPMLPRIQFHDMLGSPLPRVHDAICSLRTLASVPRVDEDTYIDHLTRSLARKHDILILGCPSSDAFEGGDQPAPGAEGLVPEQSAREKKAMDRSSRQRRYYYARTGAQLKALAEGFFDNVFLFSIAGDDFQPGASNSADYVLVVCCNKKN